MASLRNKKLAKLVGRVKYTLVGQRSQEYERHPAKKARTYLRTNFLRMARAPPKVLGTMLVSDGSLCDLCGVPCPKPNGAEAGVPPRYGGKAELGKMVGGKDAFTAPNTASNAVLHRWGYCRARVRINHSSQLFTSVGGDNHGVSMMSLAFWNAAVGISLTHTVLQLDVAESVVASW